MSKKDFTKGPVDPDFSYADASPEQLKSLWDAWYPGGSGPLGAARTICALIENICYLRGIDTSNWRRE